MKIKIRNAFTGSTPASESVAIFTALLTWLGVIGLLWELFIPHLCPTNAGELSVLVAVIPATIAYAAVKVVADIRN